MVARELEKRSINSTRLYKSLCCQPRTHTHTHTSTKAQKTPPPFFFELEGAQLPPRHQIAVTVAALPLLGGNLFSRSSIAVGDFFSPQPPTDLCFCGVFDAGPRWYGREGWKGRVNAKMGLSHVEIHTVRPFSPLAPSNSKLIANTNPDSITLYELFRSVSQHVDWIFCCLRDHVLLAYFLVK